MKTEHKGIAPNGPYLQGSVEAGDVLELKKGNTLNTVTEVAPANTEYSPIEPSRPSCGASTRDREIKMPTPQTPKQAQAHPVSQVTINKQLGSNRFLGN